MIIPFIGRPLDEIQTRIAKPRIGIRVNLSLESIKKARMSFTKIKTAYGDAITEAGGRVVYIPNFPRNEEGKGARSAVIGRWLNKIDGIIIPGGDFAFPDDWYVGNARSPYMPSTRLQNDIDLTKAALERDTPILGICAGMQMLACMHGCKMTGNIHELPSTRFNHRGSVHLVHIEPETKLRMSVRAAAYEVVSLHNEAIVTVTDQVKVSARSPDLVIEAIEIPSKHFAIGVEWHPENGPSVYDDNLLKSFVAACRIRMRERLQKRRLQISFPNQTK